MSISYKILETTSEVTLQSWYGEITGKIQQREKDLNFLYQKRKEIVEVCKDLGSAYRTATSSLEKKFWGLLQADKDKKKEKKEEVKKEVEEPLQAPLTEEQKKLAADQKEKDKKQKKKNARKRKKIEDQIIDKATGKKRKRTTKERIKKKLKKDDEAGPPVEGIIQPQPIV